MAPSSRINQCK